MDRPAAVASADIDGDGTDDLVYGVEGGNTYLQRGLGDGEFGPASLLFETDTFSTAILAFDIDADGDVEILRGGQLWTPIAGGGYGVVSGNPLLANPSQLVDLDGDGVLDIFTSNSHWNRGLGSLAFAPSEFVIDVPAFSSNAVAVADLNGDGHLDLIRAQTNSSTLPDLAVFPGTGSIPFASGSAIPIGNQLFFSDRTTTITVLDGDLDGDLDLVLGASQFPAPLVYVENLGAFAFGTEVPIATGLPSEIARSADYDGDGQADLVVGTMATFGQLPKLVTYRGLGGGNFGPANIIDEPSMALDLLVKDLDGDDRDEIIHVRDESRVDLLDIEATGSFSRQSLNETLSVEAVVDVDQDGRLDLVAVADDPSRVVWKRRLADGSYGRAREIVPPLAGLPDGLTSFAAGDMDGDGLVDIVTARNVVTDTIVLSRALPGGGFAPPATIADVTPSLFGVFTRVLVSDIDQDQDLDIFIVADPSGEVSTVSNLGGGSFGAPSVASPIQSAPTPVIADIDGDGLLDIAHFFAVGVEWRRALGDGTFAPREALIEVSLGRAAFADRSGDGIPDLIAPSADGSSTRAATASGPGEFPPFSFTLSAPSGLGAFSLVDLSLDGTPEIIALRQFPDRLSVFAGIPGNLTLGLDITPGIPSDSDALSSTSVLALDIDADGDLDLVLNPANASGRSFDIVIFENVTLNELGVAYCGPAVVNSTGEAGVIGAFGSASVSINQVELRASSLPPGQAGFFITSLTTDFVASIPNSVGNLCLGGQIGRFVGPGQIGMVDSSGSLVLPVDLGAFPSPAQGFVPVQGGQTWNFQAWHRDILQGQSTSNFTTGLSVTFL